MSSRREIVRAGVQIICEHLLSVLLKLKRQRRRRSMRRWIMKRNNLGPEHVENSWNRLETPERQFDEQLEKLHPNRRYMLTQEKRSKCYTMNLRSAQRECGNLTSNEISMGDGNPLLFNVVPQTMGTAMQGVNIKQEIKQEVQDIPESLCISHSTNNSFAICARGTSRHVSEDGQQFATLCEVYMPPSPSSSKGHHGGCNDSDDEGIHEGVTACHKIKHLKMEVSSLRMQLANMESGMKTFLGDDQLLYLRQNSSQEIMWSEATIRKAKKIQAACGVKGYNRLREMGFPLPAKSTVAQKMRQFNIKHVKNI